MKLDGSGAWRVLLVGLGQAGMGYDLAPVKEGSVLTHAKAFSLHSDFRLVCGVDVNPTKRESFERAYGVPTLPSIREALLAHEVDVCVLATPTAMHAGQVLQILDEPKVRAILCEKPLSNQIQESRDIVRLCKEKGIQIFSNYGRLSEPGVREVKLRIESGIFQGPFKGVVWYTKGLLHNGSHFLNLLEFWLGPVTGFLPIQSGELKDLSHSRDRPDFRVTFLNGEAIFLAHREDDFTYHSIELLGRNGKLQYESGGQNIGWTYAETDANSHGYKNLAMTCESIQTGADRCQWHVVTQLAVALQGGNAHLCSGQEALDTHENIEAILTRANE